MARRFIQMERAEARLTAGGAREDENQDER